MDKSMEIDKIISNYSSALRVSEEKIWYLDQNPEKAYIEGSRVSVWQGKYEYHEARVITAKKDIYGDIKFFKDRISFFENLRNSKVRRFITRTKNELKISSKILESVSAEFEKYKSLTPSTVEIKLYA